jgi:cation diffusion facilitator family transporter
MPEAPVAGTGAHQVDQVRPVRPHRRRYRGGVGDESAPHPANLKAESTLTVVVAGLANLSIAVAKTVAGVVSGSSAMLSEAVHSLVDTITEVLLFIAIRRGHRPSDDEHPFGHGREAYLWALVAALATFTAGAGVSIAQGVAKLRSHTLPGHVRVSFAVLAVAFVIEGVSLTRALTQVRDSARRWNLRPWTYLRVTTDTTVKAVTLEDSAALVGLVLAGGGLALTVVTHSPAWDGIASLLIGALLVAVAVTLGKANASLLVGEQVRPAIRRALKADLESLPGVLSVPLLITSVLGPEQVMVAAKVEFADHLSADDIEALADEAERRFVARHPGIRLVFLDPTGRR